MKQIFTLLFFSVLGLNSLYSATFVSIASGDWNTATTWTITVGVDTDGNNFPDGDDDVTIVSPHIVTLSATTQFKTLQINLGARLTTNSEALIAKGNFTKLGVVSGIMKLYVQGACTFSSSTTFVNTGDWYVQTGNLTIAPGTVINKPSYIYISSGRTVTNLGTVNFIAGSISLASSSATWINGANSILTIVKNIGGNGTLNASAINNTVTYSSTNVTLIYGKGTYYNLNINSNSGKAATTNLVVLNDLTIGTGASNVLNLSGFNLTLGGNWTNTAGATMTNQGTVTFNGSGTQIINRSGTANEVIDNMVVSGSGTTVLNKALTTTNLTVSSGLLDLSASSFSVNLLGDLVNNANISCSQGSFNLNGSVAQTISGSSNTQFFDLSLNNAMGATINSPQSLSNALTVTNGNFNSSGNFTLLSDAGSTARIAPVGAGGSFSNNMTINQFISTRVKGWHDISSPVQATTINDWDNEMYMSGIGAEDGTPGPAGVDGSANGFFSVRKYNEPTASWINVQGSGSNILQGTGYEIWCADNQNTWTGKAINTVGVPTFGSTDIILSFRPAAGAFAGVNLVGNPFASFIDYSLVSKTNAPGSILILDNTGNYSDYGTNAIIPAHQGFWVTATNAVSSITIPETAKTTDVATQFYRKMPNYGIKLVFSNPSLPFYHENTVNFNSKSTLKFDVLSDALFIKSPNSDAPAMYMDFENDGQLITNAINSDENEVAIPLTLYTPIEGLYYIQPTVLSTDNYNYAWIENTKTGETFDLDKSIAISGNNDETNKDYVLHLSKEARSSSISQTVFENDLLVFNTENNINIKATNAKHVLSKVLVHSLSGQLVLEESNITVESGNTIHIDISTLNHGMYLVQVIDEMNHSTTKKIIR